MYRTKHIVGLFMFLMGIGSAFSQLDSNSEIYQLLKTKDSILFNAAFNTCDTATIQSLFTEDFEFYHDKGGPTIGRDTFLKPIAEACAKRGPNEPQPSKRFLVPNSLEVYPLYKNGELYGAIQHGVHRFQFLNENKEYQQGDTAKFTHLWLLEGEEWKIKRELSYDHQSFK